MSFTPTEVKLRKEAQWDWIKQNCHDVSILETVTSPYTFMPTPYRVMFHRASEYTMFMLKWS